MESLKSGQEESLSYLSNSNSKLANRREKIESELTKAVDILTKANQQVLKHESKVEAAKEITSKQNVQSNIQSIVKENSVPGYLGGINDLFSYSHNFTSKDTVLIFLKGKTVNDEILEARKNWIFDSEIKQSKSDIRGRVLIVKRLASKK